MVKISVAELESALTLLKKTSQDVYVVVREDGHGLNIQFQNVDGQMTHVMIYTEEMRSFAKVSTTENLGQMLGRLKK